MSQLLEQYRSYIRDVRSRGAETTRKYMVVLGDFAAWLEQKGVDKDLASVGKPELLEFLMLPGAGTKGPAPVRWNLRLAALRSFYGYLFKEDVVPVNPALKIDRQPVKAKKPLPLNADEYLELAEALDGSSSLYRSRNAALGALMYHALLRVQSVVSIDLEQVDLNARAIVNVRVKGGKHETVELNEAACEALDRYLADRSRFAGAEHEPALFLSDRGRRLAVRTAQEIIPKAGRATNIKRRVRCHLLRHSGATELALAGEDVYTLKDLCGHESIVTTQGYVHLRGGEKRRAVDRLDALVRARARSRPAARRVADGASAEEGGAP